MPIRPSLLAFALFAGPVLGEEIACSGAFAVDSSEARLVELHGAENVWTGIVPGPEGTEMLATRVFPDDPEQMLEFTWWDEESLTDPGYIRLSPALTAPGGVRIGMSIAEVEALNGEPFTLLGFGWDYGGAAGFESGALADLPGGCHLALRFFPDDEPVEADVDAIYGDRELKSSDPLLELVGAYVDAVSLGYPHPDFRD